MEAISDKGLSSLFKKKDDINLSEVSIILDALQTLFLSMDSANEFVFLLKFKEYLTNAESFKEFDDSEQHDSHQFLTILLNLLCNSKDTRTNSIKNAVQSTMKCSLQCSRCGFKNFKSGDKSNILKLPIVGKSLRECWDSYFAVEYVTDWMCQHCNMKRTVLKNFITRKGILRH